MEDVNDHLTIPDHRDAKLETWVYAAVFAIGGLVGAVLYVIFESQR